MRRQVNLLPRIMGVFALYGTKDRTKKKKEKRIPPRLNMCVGLTPAAGTRFCFGLALYYFWLFLCFSFWRGTFFGLSIFLLSCVVFGFLYYWLIC